MAAWTVEANTFLGACQYAEKGGPPRPTIFENTNAANSWAEHFDGAASPFIVSCQTRPHANAGSIEMLRFFAGEPGAVERRTPGLGTSEGSNSPLSLRVFPDHKVAVPALHPGPSGAPDKRMTIVATGGPGAIRASGKYPESTHAKPDKCPSGGNRKRSSESAVETSDLATETTGMQLTFWAKGMCSGAVEQWGQLMTW